MGLMGLQAAARYLNCHPETVRSLILNGKLKGKKRKRAWVIRESDIHRYIKTNRLP